MSAGYYFQIAGNLRALAALGATSASVSSAALTVSVAQTNFPTGLISFGLPPDPDSTADTDGRASKKGSFEIDVSEEILKVFDEGSSGGVGFGRDDIHSPIHPEGDRYTD